MRAKRRTDIEIAESKRGVENCSRSSSIYKKVDTSKNGSEMDSLVEKHKEVEKKLFPMKIDAKTTIYVPKKHLNEEYRIKWMKSHGYLKEEKEVKKKKRTKIGGMPIAEFDMREVMSKLEEGYSVKEAAKEVGISSPVLYKYLKEDGIKIPTTKERVCIFKRSGMNIEEIARRMKISTDVVGMHYRKV